MSEISNVNSFEGGLTPDIHPLSIQPNAMTDALNLEIMNHKEEEKKPIKPKHDKYDDYIDEMTRW